MDPASFTSHWLVQCSWDDSYYNIMKRKFIINPAAGKGLNKKKYEEMQHFFKNALAVFDYVLTKNREDITLQTRLALQQGFQQIISVGGDGTLNAVVNGFFEQDKLINTEALLAVAPMGTGSDYYRGLTFGNKQASWQEIVLHAKTKTVDVGVLDFVNEEQQRRYFINMASVGIIPYIVQLRQKFPKIIPAKYQYLLPSIQAILYYPAVPMHVTVDGKIFQEKLIGITMSKGRYAGGGMCFGLNAQLDDGLFDINLIGEILWSEKLTKLGALYTGHLDHLTHTQKLKGANIYIQPSKPTLIEFEGEVAEPSRLQVSIVPKAIKVCVPT